MAESKNLRHLVWIMNTDLDGNKHLFIALKRIKGIGFSFSHAICNIASIPYSKKAGYLSDEEIKRLHEILSNLDKFNFPDWMLNRRIDPETGETKHLFTSDLKFVQQNDIKILQKVKSNRGLRHHWGLPTRGQRTKSNFRRSKSKKKVSSGVKTKKSN
jgi:ribosomal protein S13